MQRQSKPSPIVVVGAGIAGVSAAAELRTQGYTGDILLLSKESVPPYDRPPLSKEVLCNDALPNNLFLRSDSFYAEQHIQLRLGAEVVSIDPAKKRVALSDGASISYSKLLLAMGSRVRQLDGLALGARHVHYLRNVEDAMSLRKDMARLQGQGRLSIIGAGIIGLEVAAAATALGLDVTVIEAGPRPLARAASAVLAQFLADAHAERGIDIRCNARIDHIEFHDAGHAIFLSDGARIDADIVVVGIGVVPNSELASLAGLATGPQGIHVDEFGKTSVDDIYAAGEVALHGNTLYTAPRREETWQHAVSHGEHVAKCMLGCREAYAETTSYWTDQYDYAVQVFGTPIGESDVVRGDVASGSFMIFHLIDGAVHGVTAVNAARELRKAKPLVLTRAMLTESVLGDTSVELAKHMQHRQQHPVG